MAIRNPLLYGPRSTPARKELVEMAKAIHDEVRDSMAGQVQAVEVDSALRVFKMLEGKLKDEVKVATAAHLKDLSLEVAQILEARMEKQLASVREECDRKMDGMKDAYEDRLV